MKKYKLNSSNLIQLVKPFGFATATDKITVEGRSIGYMYRDTPIGEHDTGWRFFAGDEDEEYINNQYCPTKVGI